MVWPVEAVSAMRAVTASLLGAVVGWQRQRIGQEAGMRTFAAVCLGACAFGLIAPGDTRIAAQVISGIGFLGVGVIIRGRTHVHGLTTAAALWVTAAIGMGVAYGRYIDGAVLTVVLLGLLCLPTKKPETEKQSLAAAGVKRFSQTAPRSKI
jgi:putative Mg2+ transporter-C (MgtC) family protein